MSNIFIARNDSGFGLNALITSCPFRCTDIYPQIKICGPHSRNISAFNFQCERPHVSLFIQFSVGPDPKWANRYSLGYLHCNDEMPCFIYVSSYKETDDSIKWVLFITYKNVMVRLDVIKKNGMSICCKNYTFYSQNTLKAKTPSFSSFAVLDEDQINQLMPLLIE
jgi:hypothetical protein